MKQSSKFTRAIRMSLDTAENEDTVGIDYEVGDPMGSDLTEAEKERWSIATRKISAAMLIARKEVRQPPFAAITGNVFWSTDETERHHAGWRSFRNSDDCIAKQYGKGGPLAVAVDPFYAADRRFGFETRHLTYNEMLKPTVLFAVPPGQDQRGYFLGHFRSVAELKRNADEMMIRWFAFYRRDALAELNKKLNTWGDALRK